MNLRIFKSGFYLHQRFFKLLVAEVFAAILAFIFPVLYVWVLWSLCLFAVVFMTDIVLLYGFGNRMEAGRDMGDKFSNGEDNPVGLCLRNRYPFRVRVRILDEIPPEFQLRNLQLSGVLKAGERCRKTYWLHPVRRGEYIFGKLRVFVASPLSLAERRYSYEGETTVAVYPSFMAMHKYELLAFTGRYSGRGVKKIRVAGVTTTFDQIKPYVQGDDPRVVNWKATAKCNQLMVNTYTEEHSQAIYCVIDKGRTMQSPFHQMTMLDYAINATLALSNVVLKKGDKVGLLTFAHKPGTFIKADNRRLQLSHVSEALYCQQTNFLESDFEQLCVTLSRQVHTRSMLVLFTNFETVTGMRRHLPALRRLARNHLVFLILFENTEVNKVLTQPSRQLKEIYFKAVAGNFILEKKRIVRELRRAGIYTLLTEPEKLTANTINGYLELKERRVV